MDDGVAGRCEAVESFCSFPDSMCSSGFRFGEQAGDDANRCVGPDDIPPGYFSVGGAVSGLVGSGLVLQNNDGDDLAISSNGIFTFPSLLMSGDAYAVTIAAQPDGQTCRIANSDGVVASANIADVTVSCGAAGYVGPMGSAICGTSTLQVTLSAGAPVGDTAIVRVAMRSQSTAAVSATDNRGNTYTIDADASNTASPGARIVVLRTAVSTALVAGDVVTVTIPSPPSSAAVVDRFTGIATTSAVIDKVTNVATSPTPTASVTVATTPAVVLGAVATSNNPIITQPASFTSLGALTSDCGGAPALGETTAAFLLPSAAGSFQYTPTFNAQHVWAAAIIAYRGQ